MRPGVQDASAPTSGFTLVEVLAVMLILAILMMASVPILISFQDHARVQRAIADVRTIAQAIDMYFLINDEWPASLADVDLGFKQDPWGKPYQYLRIATSPRGAVRKNRFLVPINTYYDLYSMGPDGKTRTPLTARDSRDDIIRANDGDFIGIASNY